MTAQCRARVVKLCILELPLGVQGRSHLADGLGKQCNKDGKESSYLQAMVIVKLCGPAYA